MPSRLGVLVFCISTLCLAQSADTTTNAPVASAATTTKSSLESLEALGVSFLNSILSPSTTATAAPSSSLLTSVSPSLSNAKPAETASPTLPLSTPTMSSSMTKAIASANHSIRNIIIVLSIILGLLLLSLILFGLWLCLSRRKSKKRSRRVVTPSDDGEAHSWRAPKEQEMVEHGRIPTEPQPVMEPANAYTGHQANRRLSWQDPFADPAPLPNQTTHQDAPHDVAEHNSLIEKPHNNTPTAPTNWDLVAANNYHAYRNSGGYAPVPRAQVDDGRRSVSSLPGRVPTPMFGTGREAGEAAPQRNSNGSSQNGNAAWVPRRSPRRPHSLTSSPLAPLEERMPLRRDHFDFGFDHTPTRYSGAGMPATDPHHQF